MNMLPVAIGIIMIVASLGYVVAEPFFQTFPAKLFRVQITRTAGGLGADVTVGQNISEVGLATVTILDKGRLEAVPPLHSYLIMEAGSEKSYAVVFWSSGPRGGQIATFNRLIVLVSSLNDPVTFTYSNEGSSDLSLGTY